MESNWILGSEMFGVHTHYILEDDGHVLLRMEGRQSNLPFVELVSVAYEVDLYKTFIPFCSKSDLLHRIGIVEFIVHAHIWTPFAISRDALVHAFCSDCLMEYGKVVLLCSSVDSYPGIELPQAVSGYFHDRIDLKTMKVIVEATSPTDAKV